jgi:DNA gyrase subunit A
MYSTARCYGPTVEHDDPFATERMRERLAILHAMSSVIERREEFMDVVGAAAGGEPALHAVMAHFELNEIQAHAVLDLQVRRFTDHERQRIAEQLDDLRRRLDQP